MGPIKMFSYPFVQAFGTKATSLRTAAIIGTHLSKKDEPPGKIIHQPAAQNGLD